jgi:FAD/FMN-containing dehydrogenase
MTWPGAANIAAPGVAIDLKALNITTVSADKKTAHVQPGGGWGVVYNTLEPLDLIVVGGRSMTVASGLCAHQP